MGPRWLREEVTTTQAPRSWQALRLTRSLP